MLWKGAEVVETKEDIRARLDIRALGVRPVGMDVTGPLSSSAVKLELLEGCSGDALCVGTSDPMLRSPPDKLRL